VVVVGAVVVVVLVLDVEVVVDDVVVAGLVAVTVDGVVVVADSSPEHATRVTAPAVMIAASRLMAGVPSTVDQIRTEGTRTEIGPFRAGARYPSVCGAGRATSAFLDVTLVDKSKETEAGTAASDPGSHA
jgi:hypothetical protein